MKQMGQYSFWRLYFRHLLGLPPKLTWVKGINVISYLKQTGWVPVLRVRLDHLHRFHPTSQ
jgi:hypothetical protein